MKLLFFILSSLGSIISYSQPIFSEISTPSSVDTSLKITGIANVGLAIDNISLNSFTGVDNLSTGIDVKTGHIGVVAQTTNNLSVAIAGVSHHGTGVVGYSRSSSESGVYGENQSGNGIEGLTFENDVSYAGVLGRAGSAMGVSGVTGDGIGVNGSASGGIGVNAISTVGTGLVARSINGIGMEVSSFSDVAGKFSSERADIPDIELPTSIRTVGNTLTFNTEGIISSDVNSSNSSLRFWSNQGVSVELDRDGSDINNSFVVRDSDDERIFRVRESTGAEIRGPLELFAISGDNGIIESDRSATSSDLIFDSNHDIALRLDSNGGESGELRVTDSNGDVIFRLFENGNLNIAGTLNQSSDVNVKNSISTINNSFILSKIKELPIYNWKYDDEDILHIGPMAQDFYKMFELGQGETTISSVDADGIALSGIKALIDENQKLKEEIVEIKKILKELVNSKN